MSLIHVHLVHLLDPCWSSSHWAFHGGLEPACCWRISDRDLKNCPWKSMVSGLNCWEWSTKGFTVKTASLKGSYRVIPQTCFLRRSWFFTNPSQVTQKGLPGVRVCPRCTRTPRQWLWRRQPRDIPACGWPWPKVNPIVTNCNFWKCFYKNDSLTKVVGQKSKEQKKVLLSGWFFFCLQQKTC